MKAKRLLKKLNYLPRWAWYMLSFFTFGPFGIVGVYLTFHVLNKMAAEETEEASAFEWSVDVGSDGVHVRKGSARKASASGMSAYHDEECTVTSEEDVETQWRQTAASARRAKAQNAPAREEPIAENASVSDVIAEGQSAMARIRHANDLIPDPELSAQIDSIENSCGQILSILEQRPQLLPQLRTFLRYYLPTTLHLLDARAKLENTANTRKAREVRQRISEAVGVIDKAFLKQVEALDEYRFIDLESEMDVLRDMLRADGLLDEEAEEDPFAEVLAQRKTSPGKPLGAH